MSAQATAVIDTSPASAPAGLALPTGPLARLLLGLCRQGAPLVPTKVAKGWATYCWQGLDGDEATLELRTGEHPEHSADDEAAALALHRAATEARAGAELMAVLACLVELNGGEGQWRWARVTELLHGSRAKTDRHNAPVQGWTALLERARWHLEPGRRRGAKAKPGAAVVAGQALVGVERLNRCSATVRLYPGVARQLGAECREVAPRTLELCAPCPNPEGNHPSRAVRASARLAALFATDAGAGELRVEDLMARYGGVDLDPVARRRHIPGWTDHVLDEVSAGLRAIGHALAAAPLRARRALATVVRFARPATPAARDAAGQAPSRLGTAAPAPPSTSARPGSPRSSRAP